MVAADPAYTPASSGSTDLDTTWVPKRSPTSSAIAGSVPRSQLNGRDGSSATAVSVASSTRPASDCADVGMPFTVPSGIGCRPPPA